MKYTFSGHDSFQCRLLWLKKGYDFLKKGHTFNDADAPVLLGVGNNMVRSMRYWMRSFGMFLNESDQLSSLADLIFCDANGADPYLEDQFTLWLLHYQLVNVRHASTYWLIFNELRKRKIEFTKDDYVHYIALKAEQEKFPANPSTVGDDFVTFTKMYLRGTRQAKDIDETASGLLIELGLLQTIERKSDDDKSTSMLYTIPLTEREDLPAELVLYCILNAPNLGISISLETLENDPGMPCSVFAMNRSGLLRKIEELTNRFPKTLIYSDQAGIRELQFKENPINSLKFLEQLYESADV
jgi:hypothetical protein